MTRLWIRADGSNRIGLGHIMRTVALGQAARRHDIEVTFVVQEDPVGAALPARFGLEVATVADPADTAWLGRVRDSDAVFVDGYHFEQPLLEAVVAATGRAALMTDLPHVASPLPFLVNQNPVESPRYEVPADTTLLIGPDYALVREEFRPHRSERGQRGGRILLVLGGAGPADLTAAIAAAIRSAAPQAQLTILRGPAAEPLDDVDAAIIDDPADVPATLGSADVVVSAAGSTTWELLYMGIPTILVEIADNQSVVGRGVSAAGAAVFLGRPPTAVTRLSGALRELADPAVRRRLSTAARALVDGHGADRVLRHLFPDVPPLPA